MTIPKRWAAALCLTTAVFCAAPDAVAVRVARVTRRGYILTDEPDGNQYGAQIPVGNTRNTAVFLADVTLALVNGVEGFHEGRYLAAMQVPSIQSPLAFYLPIRNDVRGIGARSSLDGRTEVFDSNRSFSTAFTLDGFLFLNSLRFYTDPRAVNFGRFLICTQEFGHRFGVNVTTPPYPAEVNQGDGGVDGGAAPALAADALLGRGSTTASGMIVNRSHWSYFFNSGGSPMEGNQWAETTPGTFQTQRPTLRFSDFDLYLMGLIPSSMVRPTYLIAEPQGLPRGITRESQTELYNRTVTVRGRRVPFTVHDMIRANGVRNPAYPSAPRDLDVTWMLWAEPDRVNDDLAAEFDEAVDSCALGYSTSTGNRGHLVTTVPQPPDAGTPVVEDGGGRADVALPEDVPGMGMQVPTPDAGPAADARPTPGTAGGGCDCRSVPGRTVEGRWAFAALGLALTLRRRRRL